MLGGDYSRLQAWLRGWHVSHELLEVSELSSAERLRHLNALESRFDNIVADEITPTVDWERVRQELDLVPAKHDAWYEVTERIVRLFSAKGYSAQQIARARRLWCDFLVVGQAMLSETQAPEGWIAGLEYLIRRLYFVTPTKQRALAARYHVSASTVSMRYRSLVDVLGLVIFDHPSRKRLDALRALAVDTGSLSEREFRSRLLAGELSSL